MAIFDLVLEGFTYGSLLGFFDHFRRDIHSDDSDAIFFDQVPGRTAERRTYV